MAERILRGESVGSGEPFSDQVSVFKGRYNNLLALLGDAGTEVERDRTLETDPDISPHNFVRGASHIFVFPPQEVELTDADPEKVGVVPGTPPYTLFKESKIAEFDPSLVQAKAVVTYDDAGFVPELRFRDSADMLGSDTLRQLEQDARDAIEAIFVSVDSATPATQSRGSWS